MNIEEEARAAAMFVTGSNIEFALYNSSMGERMVLCNISPLITRDVG